MAGLLQNAGTRLGDGSVMRIAATLDPTTMDIMMDDYTDDKLMPLSTKMSTRTSQTMREGTFAVAWRPEAKKAFGIRDDEDNLPHLGVFANARNVPAAPAGVDVLVDGDKTHTKRALARQLCRSVRCVGEVGREFTVAETDAGSTAVGTGTIVELMAHRTMAFPGKPPGLFAPVRLDLDTSNVSDGRFSIEEVSSKSHVDQARAAMSVYLAAAAKTASLSPKSIAAAGGPGSGAKKTSLPPIMLEDIATGNKMLMGILGIVLAILDNRKTNIVTDTMTVKALSDIIKDQIDGKNGNPITKDFAKLLTESITPQMSVYLGSNPSNVIPNMGLDLISNAFFDLRESNRSIGVATSIRARDAETYQADVAINTIS
jgi:hypothetical protein